MLEEMVKKIIRALFSSTYRHLVRPAVVWARITRAQALEDGWNAYTLTVLDRFGSRDENYPVIPGVKSKRELQKGDTVAIAWAYGELTPVILEEVEL